MLIRAKAPLRVSFAGGGTDVPPYPQKEGGSVLSTTINKYAYGTLRPRTDGQINVESLDFGVSVNYDLNDELIYDGKLDLVKAAIKNLEGQGTSGFDLFLHSDAPPGTGLGSSSTMMATLVGLLKEFQNKPLTNYEMARLAYEIERKDLRVEGGMQDQYAAIFGGFNYIEFFGEDDVIVNPLKVDNDIINELEHNLLLCYTGKTRLSAKIIDDQVDRYERGEEETLEGMKKLKEITIQIKNALLQKRLNDFGHLLHLAWENKKKMSHKISNPEINKMYEAARDEGALGGKISGAGGGGYMLLYCKFDKKHKVSKRLKEMGGTITEFGFDPNGLQTWRIDE